MNQLSSVPGDDVLRLGVQGVRDGDRDGNVLALIQKVAGRAFSLARVLVRLEVVDNRVGIRCRLLLKTAGGCPRCGLFVLPLLNHRVASGAEMFGSLQGESVGILPSQGLALTVPSGYHIALLGLLLYQPLSLVGVALQTTMPEATVELEDGFRLRVITIHPSTQNMSLTAMPAPRVMDVDASLLCLPLEPFDCNETATRLRVEGTLIGGSRELNAVVRAINLGLPTTASACMPHQVARLCESRLTIPTSVVARDLFEVSDQEGVPIEKPHCQNWPTGSVIVGWEVGQDEVTVRLHRVSGNALFEVLFKQGQMLVGQPIAQAWTLSEEGFLKLTGFAHVVSHMGTPMNSDAAKETTIVPIGVQRQNSVLVAKAIGKTPETEEQRMAIQDDFDINHQGLLVSPLGVGPSLVFKPQLFLLAHPGL